MEHEEVSTALVSVLYRAKRTVNWSSMTGGLSSSELAVMRAMRSVEEKRPDQPLRMGDISTVIFSSKPAATQVVTRLENRGLIERFSVKGDRRTVCVRLTDAGRRYFVQNHRAGMEMADRLVDRLGVEKTRQMVALLEEAVEIARELGCAREEE